MIDKLHRIVVQDLSDTRKYQWSDRSMVSETLSRCVKDKQISMVCSHVATKRSNCIIHVHHTHASLFLFICCRHMATQFKIAWYNFIINMYCSRLFIFCSHMAAQLSNCMIHVHHKTCVALSNVLFCSHMATTSSNCMIRVHHNKSIAPFYLFVVAIWLQSFQIAWYAFIIKVHRSVLFIFCSHLATKLSNYMILVHPKTCITLFYLCFCSNMATPFANCMILVHHEHASIFSIYLLQPYGYTAFKSHDTSSSKNLYRSFLFILCTHMATTLSNCMIHFHHTMHRAFLLFFVAICYNVSNCMIHIHHKKT